MAMINTHNNYSRYNNIVNVLKIANLEYDVSLKMKLYSKNVGLT